MKGWKPVKRGSMSQFACMLFAVLYSRDFQGEQDNLVSVLFHL